MYLVLKRRAEPKRIWWCVTSIQYTVKPVYNDHPWDQKKVVVVQRWSLFGGSQFSLIKIFH